jgi:uncharacterized protein (DUF488 family)
MSAPDDNPIFTIGHSTRSIDEFIAMLRGASVTHLIDVRTIPRSRTNPQYNLDVLPGTLAQFQMAHTVIPELGGRRPRQRSVDPDTNAFWQNQSFHNYADYALSDEFQSGLRELVTLADERVCAIMCSEAVWWRCHRRMIADHLLLRGRKVLHLMGADRQDPAKMTPGAIPTGNLIYYPASP